jgi:hypothetical protein
MADPNRPRTDIGSNTDTVTAQLICLKAGVELPEDFIHLFLGDKS